MVAAAVAASVEDGSDGAVLTGAGEEGPHPVRMVKRSTDIKIEVINFFIKRTPLRWICV